VNRIVGTLIVPLLIMASPCEASAIFKKPLNLQRAAPEETKYKNLKTQADVAEKSATYHTRLKAARIHKQARRRTMPGRKFDGTPIPPRWVNS